MSDPDPLVQSHRAHADRPLGDPGARPTDRLHCSVFFAGVERIWFGAGWQGAVPPVRMLVTDGSCAGVIVSVACNHFGLAVAALGFLAAGIVGLSSWGWD
jgi:hypothetical protein